MPEAFPCRPGQAAGAEHMGCEKTVAEDLSSAAAFSYVHLCFTPSRNSAETPPSASCPCRWQGVGASGSRGSRSRFPAC